jgi:hypothetical protein
VGVCSGSRLAANASASALSRLWRLKMGIKERERRVEVFFYGLFMDEELLHGKGLEPEGREIAAIDGLANLVGDVVLVRSS